MTTTATVLPLTYTFSTHRLSNWTSTQENNISSDYPFLFEEKEDVEQYVARTYLQFLWLPESIMPLTLFVPSFRRIAASTPSSSSHINPHPLHHLLHPLLLSTRTLTNKYHKELPLVLSQNGGAGELEETMMWYSISHEKGDEGVSYEHLDGPWGDENWKKGYMTRMERREVLIQILLLFLKLSLPGPVPDLNEESDGKKKKKKKGRKRMKLDPTIYSPSAFQPFSSPSKATPLNDTMNILEAYMDKLSMWQLIGNLERPQPQPQPYSQSQSQSESRPSLSTTTNTKSDPKNRDWIQVFSEDIVDRFFKSSLPELCELLHSKVFPSSPFSEDEDDSAIASLLPPKVAQPRSLSRTGSSSTVVSKNQSFSRAPSLSNSLLPSPTKSISAKSTSQLQNRSRSRSLSLVQIQEQERQQRALALASASQSKYGVGGRKRIINREVSMSRVFKPKVKASADSSTQQGGKKVDKERGKGKKDYGVTLVEDTPVKPRAGASQFFLESQSQLQSTQSQSFALSRNDTSTSLPVLSFFTSTSAVRKPNTDVILVEDTPVKPKLKSQPKAVAHYSSAWRSPSLSQRTKNFSEIEAAPSSDVEMVFEDEIDGVDTVGSQLSELSEPSDEHESKRDGEKIPEPLGFDYPNDIVDVHEDDEDEDELNVFASLNSNSKTQHARRGSASVQREEEEWTLPSSPPDVTIYNSPPSSVGVTRSMLGTNRTLRKRGKGREKSFVSLSEGSSGSEDDSSRDKGKDIELDEDEGEASKSAPHRTLRSMRVGTKSGDINRR